LLIVEAVNNRTQTGKN